ncbi:recombinase family protein [Dactylosporangium roseum]|uniref:Recombinase family protein n=1 Tax=Dactylosporangium roseum TaxID=47989 RepID=A0ABY5ZDN6_9ACTN|nr:recombinase family protein [Dactylosporangium roseum]
MNPNSKITSSHLSRLAIVYVRQSTVAQVRYNTESTTRQYALAGTAAELGWLAEQIVLIDADLGVSGRFGSDRDGYREIVARLCMGEVGAVFGLEVSRFGRSNADLTRLMSTLLRCTSCQLQPRAESLRTPQRGSQTPCGASKPGRQGRTGRRSRPAPAPTAEPARCRESLVRQAGSPLRRRMITAYLPYGSITAARNRDGNTA